MTNMIVLLLLLLLYVYSEFGVKGFRDAGFRGQGSSCMLQARLIITVKPSMHVPLSGVLYPSGKNIFNTFLLCLKGFCSPGSSVRPQEEGPQELAGCCWALEGRHQNYRPTATKPLNPKSPNHI